MAWPLTVMNSFVRFQVSFIVLESFHTLGKDRKDVSFLDGVMHRQAWKSIDMGRERQIVGVSTQVPHIQSTTKYKLHYRRFESWDAVRRYIGRDIPLLVKEPSASCSPKHMSKVSNPGSESSGCNPRRPMMLCYVPRTMR